MRVTLNGAAVYAFATTYGDGYLVRVSADEWERLGLIPGQQVRVGVSTQGRGCCSRPGPRKSRRWCG